MQETDPVKGKVYLSCAWGEEGSLQDDIANREETELGKTYEVVRDKNKMRMGDSISEFMLEIGMGERVLVILSAKYLKSPYCVNELHLLYQRSLGQKADFKRRVKTIVLDDTKISDPISRAAHAKHWREHYAELQAVEQDLGSEDKQAMELVRRWHADIGNILKVVADTLSDMGVSDLNKIDWQQLCDRMGD